MKINDVIGFLESLKKIKINGKLPFGTTDYYYIDDMIKYLKSINHNEPRKT